MSVWMRLICMLWAGSAVAFFAGCQASGGPQSGNGAPQQNPSRNNGKQDAETPADLPPAKIEARTYLAAGRLHESQNRLVPAIEQYNHALAEDPDNVHILNRLGYLYDTIGNGAAAEKAYLEALRIEPANAVVHNNLAFSYILRQRWTEAQAALSRAIEIKPEFARARINLAMVLAQTGSFDEALRQFRMVLPPDESYYNMGLMYQSKRKAVEAAECYKRALQINAKLTAAGERLKRMPADVLGAADRRIEESKAAEAVARATSTQPAQAVAKADEPDPAVASPVADDATVVADAAAVARAAEYLSEMMSEAGPWLMSAARSVSAGLSTRATAPTRPASDDAIAHVPADAVQVGGPNPGQTDPSVLEVNVAALTGVPVDPPMGQRLRSIDSVLASELDSLLPPWQRSPDLVDSLRIEPRFSLENWGLGDPLNWQASPPAWQTSVPAQTSKNRRVLETSDPQ